MSELILLSNVRLSFPHLAEPQRQKGDDGTERVSYNCEFIMAPDHPGFKNAMEVVGKMALEKWGANAGNVLSMVNQDRKKRGYGNGSEKINGKTFAPYDGYANNVFVTAGSKNMPQMIGPDGKPADATNTMACQMLARKMYGGCRVNAAVKPWLQENKHGRGVRFDLVAVQFYADDTPFGEGAVDASGLFAAAPAATSAAVGFESFTGAPAAPAPGPQWAVPGAPAAPQQMPGVPFPGAAAPAPGLPSFLS